MRQMVLGFCKANMTTSRSARFLRLVFDPHVVIALALVVFSCEEYIWSGAVFYNQLQFHLLYFLISFSFFIFCVEALAATLICYYTETTFLLFFRLSCYLIQIWLERCGHNINFFFSFPFFFFFFLFLCSGFVFVFPPLIHS